MEGGGPGKGLRHVSSSVVCMRPSMAGSGGGGGGPGKGLRLI